MKATFKRSLAFLVAALMVMTCMTSLITITAFAEESIFDWAKNVTTVDGTEEGAVYQVNAEVPEEEQFKYDYAATFDGTNYKFGVRYYGTLTGTSDAFGNGNGTNLRLWIKTPGTEHGETPHTCVSDDYFFDVAYKDGAFATRMFENSSTTAHANNLLYSYDAETYPYVCETEITEDGCIFCLTVPASLIGNPGEVQYIVSVSNKITTNYCLHSNQNVNAPTSAWYEGSASLIPGYFTDAAVPTYGTETAIEGLTEEFDGTINATYKGSLIDGIEPEATYVGTWHAFAKGTSSAIFDLGEARKDISSVQAYIWPANMSGIVAPTSIKVYASMDKDAWLAVGEFDLSDAWIAVKSSNEVRWISLDFDSYLAARYIKLEVTVPGTFAFLGEVKVNTKTEASEIYKFTNSYAYTADSANVITWKMGDTLNDVNGNNKSHAWWNLAVVQWNAAENAFLVKEVLLGDCSTSNFKDTVIPDYGFIIGAHTTGANSAFATWISNLEAGDKLYFYGDYDSITTAEALAEGKFAVSETPIEGYTEYTVDSHRILTAFGYAAGDSTIFVRVGESSTIGDAKNAVSSVVKDYNAYCVIAVDANGIVTAKNVATGRRTSTSDPILGEKGDFAIPEGGYVIGIHYGAEIIDKIYVGDKVDLVNVDLASLDSEATFDNAFFVSSHEHHYEDEVVAPTCAEDGYTKHTCVCGDEYTDTPTSATGNHTYTVTTEQGYKKGVCDVCGRSEYYDLDDNLGIDITFSHHNGYNWKTFQAVIVSGRTVAAANAGYQSASFIGYKVETVDDHYEATEFYASFADVTAAAPENGFYMLACSANSAYNQFKDGALTGKIIVLDQFDLSQGFAIDTGNFPERAKHIWAVSKVTEEEPIQPETKTQLPENALVIDYAGYKHAAFNSIIAGDGETIAQVTARGNGGTAKDLNYAYNILVGADNIVIATDFALGTACTFTIPEGGYIISFNGNKSGYAALGDIEVGATITLYNINLDVVEELEGNVELTQCGFTYVNPEKPDEKTNLALDATETKPDGGATYNATLNDGIAFESGSYSAGNWFGFNKNTSDTVLFGEKSYYVNHVDFDFGEAKKWDTVRAHMWYNTGSGIANVSSIIVYASEDGINYIPIGKLAPSDETVYWTEAKVTAVEARYCRIEFYWQTLTFVMVNEVEVYECGDYETEFDFGETAKAIKTNGSLAGEDIVVVTDSANVASANLKWSISIHLRPTAEEGIYSVVGSPVIGKGSVPSFEMQEGDIILGVHSSSSNLADIGTYQNVPGKLAAMAVKEGDLVKVGFDGENATSVAKVNKVDNEYDNIFAYEKGDVNGDGKISTEDYIELRLCILGINEYANDDAKLAADVTSDGIIDALDYIAIRLHLLAAHTIEW